MIVPLGLSNPLLSASSITASPILSLTLRPGLEASNFTQTVAKIPAVTRNEADERSVTDGFGHVSGDLRHSIRSLILTIELEILYRL